MQNIARIPVCDINASCPLLTSGFCGTRNCVRFTRGRGLC
jgi:hypothetical protein